LPKNLPTEIQGKTRLYVVPFGKTQKKIVAGVPSRLRMLVYRRFMLRIASRIAEREGAKALVTGDNLSQVASQTLNNLDAVYAATDVMVLAPLMGMNKNETVALAKKIGTYETSILPYADCCTFFVARHPETRATRKQLEEAEARLDVEGLVEEAFSGAVVKEIG